MNTRIVDGYYMTAK